VVGAAGTVGLGVCRDVVDGAVEGEVDRFAWVGAVVFEELLVSQGDSSLLFPVRNLDLARQERRWGRTYRAFHSRALVHHGLKPHVMLSPEVDR
jgi:hypothetical protein